MNKASKQQSGFTLVPARIPLRHVAWGGERGLGRGWLSLHRLRCGHCCVFDGSRTPGGREGDTGAGRQVPAHLVGLLSRNDGAPGRKARRDCSVFRRCHIVFHELGYRIGRSGLEACAPLHKTAVPGRILWRLSRTVIRVAQHDGEQGRTTPGLRPAAGRGGPSTLCGPLPAMSRDVPWSRGLRGCVRGLPRTCRLQI